MEEAYNTTSGSSTVAAGSFNSSGDQNGEEEEEGTRRVIITQANGQPMTTDMEQAFKQALEKEMSAFWARERAHSGAAVPLRLRTWSASRGGWVVTPTGSNPHLNGSRLIQLVDRVRVNGHRFRAIWNSDLPRQATLTARFAGGGDARELIEDDTFGLITTNEWDPELRGQVRFVEARREEGSNYRIIRFEATEAVVQLIQAEGGVISIGFDSATIYNNKKPCKRGTPVVYRLQK